MSSSLARSSVCKHTTDHSTITAFNLDFYTEVKDLDYLVPLLEQDRRTRKFSQLNKVICEIIEDFGLVSFETLCVEVRSSRLPVIAFAV